MTNVLEIVQSTFFVEAFGFSLCLVGLVTLLLKRPRRFSGALVCMALGLVAMAGSFGMGLASLLPARPWSDLLDAQNPAHGVLKTVLRTYLGLALFLAGAVADTPGFRRLAARARLRAAAEDGPVAGEAPGGTLASASRDLMEARGELRRVSGENSRVSQQLRETMALLFGSEERFRTVFEKTTDGIALVDPANLRVTVANPGFAALSGSSCEELRGATLSELFGAGFGGVDGEALLARSKADRCIVVPLARRDGGTVRVEVSLSPVEVSGGRTFLCVARDVSEWQRLKDELESKNRELLRREADLKEANRRLSDRAEEMRAMNEKLRGLQHLKDDFLSSVSHEIRTPLTSIRSFSEILLENGDAEEEVRREFLGIIMKESERLTRLINDVLDLAKIEAGAVRLKLGRVDLNPVFADVVRLLAPLAREKDLIVERRIDPELPRVEGDRDKLQQVLTNLGSNAIRHGRPGSRVILAAQRDGGRLVRVAVHDQGPGIPEEELGGIFDRFHQGAEGQGERGDGTGLGLAICREIVALHGGRIWAESRIGLGSSFLFTLNAIDSEAPREEPAGELRFPIPRELRRSLPPLSSAAGPASRLPPPAW